MFYGGMLYVPIKNIIELYDGNYMEDNNSIYVNNI